MVDELLDTVVPGGIWLAAGLVIGSALGRRLRPVAKAALKVGMDVADRVQEVGAEAAERAQDLMAEVRQEREQARAAPARESHARRRASGTGSEG
ncbi:MAG TPA: hypothetical protein VFD49_25855 [Candidatus Dormibacteraeota bacterium]|nr:hypothetical protein [Candidatus Dormibacteraeota bacterium]